MSHSCRRPHECTHCAIQTLHILSTFSIYIYTHYTEHFLFYSTAGQVNVVTDAVNTSGVTSTSRRITVPDLRLHKDFGTLLERGSFSDVTVVVDDVEFKAHKAVLAGEDDQSTHKSDDFCVISFCPLMENLMIVLSFILQPYVSDGCMCSYCCVISQNSPIPLCYFFN